MQDKIRNIPRETRVGGRELCLCKSEMVDPQEFCLIYKDIHKERLTRRPWALIENVLETSLNPHFIICPQIMNNLVYCSFTSFSQHCPHIFESPFSVSLALFQASFLKQTSFCNHKLCILIKFNFLRKVINGLFSYQY